MRYYLAWQYITGYSTSGMRALVAQGHDVKLMYQKALVHPPFLAPFDDAELTAGLDAVGWTGEPDEELLLRELDEFQPDVLVVNSWHIPAYMKAARRWRGKALRIVVMDHQWLGTPKQWLGRVTRNLFIQPAFDAAFMPGDEQAVFARHLGFKQHEIISGLYTCDDPFFTGPQTPPRDSFLFTGRLVDVKGVDVLAAAYRSYRESAEDPWPLVIAGIGPMDEELKAIDGVELLGFVSPQDLPGGDGVVRLPAAAQQVRAVGRGGPGGGRVRSGGHLHEHLRGRVAPGPRRLQRPRGHARPCGRARRRDDVGGHRRPGPSRGDERAQQRAGQAVHPDPLGPAPHRQVRRADAGEGGRAREGARLTQPVLSRARPAVG